MATGDQQDMVTRLKAVLPFGWFQGDTPLLDALLNGFAYGLNLIFSMAIYTKLQTRISTATDGFLDLVAYDYFGLFLLRGAKEGDPTFRARIFLNLLREKATRRGIIKVITDLTGNAPVVFEPWLPSDTGAYNEGNLAYNTAGGYGSLALPYQGFITVYRPLGQGIPYVGGYGSFVGAYTTPSQLEWANPSLIAGGVTDADIYAAIADAKVEGTIAWVNITNIPVPDRFVLQENETDKVELESGTGFAILE